MYSRCYKAVCRFYAIRKTYFIFDVSAETITIMQATVQLHCTTRGGNVHPQDVFIDEANKESPHPRLRFARSFLQHVLCDHYPSIHAGDQYRENTLKFTFQIQHVHITMAPEIQGEKRVIITGLLLD